MIEEAGEGHLYVAMEKQYHPNWSSHYAKHFTDVCVGTGCVLLSAKRKAPAQTHCDLALSIRTGIEGAHVVSYIVESRTFDRISSASHTIVTR